ncbi:MAG: purine-nucleoside phosphorylase [Candidatus Omnitrophica bacterium]|nr:purine-nucleoside phosphorylase [Candidatus Omnitrophota bacterium]MCM8777505.1 purine-nucleoside phosphorylase [Candidatus Omnitrophota bacterium]
MNEFDKVMESVEHIKKLSSLKPDIGIILGTGLDKLADKINKDVVIPYKDIPHFPVSTVKSHTGNLVIGKISGKNVVAMQGRFHLYEGYSALQIALPIRVMKFLGITTLVESNAAGGLNPLFSRGDLVVITDHINLMGHNPLIGYNDERFGPRFPDMSRVYDKALIELAENTALDLKTPLKKGVLVGLTGPNLETRAEYRFLRMLGADMVCMSTVPEVIAAVHLGLRIFGVSVITDMCLPDALKPVSLDEIIEIASRAEPKLTELVEKVIIKI